MGTQSSAFKKASKRLAKLKIAITGPSGAGKTLSSLLLAAGIGGRVALIDTENDSACLYVNHPMLPKDFEFDTLKIDPPYTAQKYFKAMDAAVAEKYDILIIDSLSHVWAGEGGLLQQKDALDSRGGNSYTNWNSITKLHEQLKGRIQYSDIHIITTMRSKQEYIMEQNDKGKTAPKKVGLAPVQREGMEYEYTVVFDVGMDHQYMVSKDRTGLFDGVVEPVGIKTGEMLTQWLSDADRTPVQAPPPEAAPARQNQRSQQQRQQTQSAPSKQVKNHATGQMVNAPGGKEVFDPGDYVIRFGEKAGLAGKKVRDLNESLLRNTLKWAGDEMKKGKVHSSISEFAQYAHDFLRSVEVQTPEPPPPEPDPNQRMFPWMG